MSLSLQLPAYPMHFISIHIFHLINFLRSFLSVKLHIIFLFITVQLLYFNCSHRRNDQLFKLRDYSYTGLNFSNKITISDSLNAVKFEYIYNGGGAAVGDVNHDGKKDLFFSGNMVSSRL
jgi:enediyne biosynthesis protein E4